MTQEERDALQRFATEMEGYGARHGTGPGMAWRDALASVYWYNARIWTGEGAQPGDGETLHAIRNNRGPAWLYDACDVEPAELQTHCLADMVAARRVARLMSARHGGFYRITEGPDGFDVWKGRGPKAEGKPRALYRDGAALS